MYKVLLIDDEKIVRVGLQSIIKWEEVGFEIIGVAQDGRQGLQQVEKYHPDIVITDLKMPNMDGLTLTKTLRKLGFQGEIMILTNYGEFELAREALRYGVYDYLLKATLRPEELLATLKTMKEKLDTKTNRVEQDKENIFAKALQVEDKDMRIIEEILKHCESNEGELHISPHKFKNPYQFITISKLESKFDLQNTENHSLDFYRQSIENIIKEMTHLDSDVKLVCGENRAVCLFVAEKFEDKSKIEKLSIQIQSHIHMYMNIKVATVIGDICIGNIAFYENLKKCIKSTELIFYKGYKCVIFQKEYDQVTNYLKISDEFFTRILKQAISVGDSNKAIKVFNDFIDGFRVEEISVIEAREFLDKLMNMIVLDYGMYFEKYKETLNGICIMYRKAIILTEAKEAINHIIYTICTYILQVNDVHYRKEVHDIIEYIKSNIDKRITLSSIAAEVNMNESYISRLFKNETGNNIVNYINVMKMEQAKELLKNPDMMIKDVAYALGFEEQSYFNKMFKKYFGMNPNEYKKIN